MNDWMNEWQSAEQSKLYCWWYEHWYIHWHHTSLIVTQSPCTYISVIMLYNALCRTACCSCYAQLIEWVKTESLKTCTFQQRNEQDQESQKSTWKRITICTCTSAKPQATMCNQPLWSQMLLPFLNSLLHQLQLLCLWMHSQLAKSSMSFLEVVDSILQLLVCSNPLRIMHEVNQAHIWFRVEAISDDAGQRLHDLQTIEYAACKVFSCKLENGIQSLDVASCMHNNYKCALPTLSNSLHTHTERPALVQKPCRWA